MPIELQTAPAPAASGQVAVPFQRRTVGPRERMAFTEQLALLLETGMPLHSALQSLRGQTSNPAYRDLLADLIADIESGQRFSEALRKHSEFFSSTYVNLIAASEGGGFMHQILEQLLAEEQKRAELRKTMASALSYPAFLLAFSFIVVVFVLVVVFPKFGDMFMRIKDELPATTIALMWMSNVLRDYWVQILAGLAGLGFVAWRSLQSTQGKVFLDAFKLRVPLLRDAFIQLYVTQSLRVLGLSLDRGVSIVDALRATRDVVDNRIFRRLYVEVEHTVQEGGTIAAGFTASKLIPDLVKQMVATAEASGNLGRVLGRVAEHYERELNRRLTTLSKMAEPVMLLVMGLVVGIIVSSLILPIFKLSRAVG